MHLTFIPSVKMMPGGVRGESQEGAGVSGTASQQGGYALDI